MNIAALQPTYARRANDPAQPWRLAPNWSVSQRVDHPDVGAANHLAHLDLEGGADQLTLVAASSPWSRGFGLDRSPRLPDCFADVHFGAIGLRLDAGADVAAWAEDLSEIARPDGASAAIDLGFDPIGLASRGCPSEIGAAATLVARVADLGLSGRPLMADGRAWHEAGATPVEELALTLAVAVSLWRTLIADGFELEAARRALAVLLPFDADVLSGVAKARAMRRLWARLEDACGLAPEPLRLHAETSWRMMTRRDVATNAMRAVTAVFAAGLGGADTITVLPQTLVVGLPDAAARRLARNTSLVMLDEAHLGAIDDVAAGSGTLEALTDALCLEAWASFQQIESSGGIENSYKNGSLAAALANSASARRRAVDGFVKGIVGTTRYARLDDAAAAVLEVSRRPAVECVGALACLRDAEPLETLRDEAESLAAIGHPPQVALVPLGEPAAWAPRAAVAASLLAAGGIAVIEGEASDPILDFAPYRGLPVCLVGDDAAYVGAAEAVVPALHAANVARVFAMDGVVAGATLLPASGEGIVDLLREIVALFEVGRDEP